MLRRATSLAMSVVLGGALGGCAGKAQQSPTLMVEGHPPRIYEYVEDGRQVREVRGWYSAEQLDQIVREYARDRVDFDFRGTQASFWIARDREWMADAHYSSGVFGTPALYAKIGWDGHVIEHEVLTVAEMLNGKLFPPSGSSPSSASPGW